MILEGKRYDIADRSQVPFGVIITADFAGKEQDSYKPRSEASVALGPSNDRTSVAMYGHINPLQHGANTNDLKRTP
jgi:hypothetical protein